MSLQVLSDEIAAGHPVTGAYDDDNAVARAQLYAKNVPKDVDTVTGQAIFEAATAADYAALDAAQTTLFLGIVGMGTILVNGTNTRAALLAMFGAGTDTRTNLQALQTRLVTQHSVLGLGPIVTSDIAKVRV